MVVIIRPGKYRDGGHNSAVDPNKDDYADNAKSAHDLFVVEGIPGRESALCVHMYVDTQNGGIPAYATTLSANISVKPKHLQIVSVAIVKLIKFAIE